MANSLLEKRPIQLVAVSLGCVKGKPGSRLKLHSSGGSPPIFSMLIF